MAMLCSLWLLQALSLVHLQQWGRSASYVEKAVGECPLACKSLIDTLVVR